MGSTHFGDDYIQKWAALAGKAVESNDRHGIARRYGTFGDKILQHMREHQVLQALFRFARQGNGATVYVDTVALPEWVPVVADPEETNIDTWSPSDLDTIEALKRQGEARTSEVAEEADCSSRAARGTLKDLAGDLVAQRQAEDGRGNAKVWIDDGLGSINPHGYVDLPTRQSPTRFSEQIRLVTHNGIVPKKSIREQKTTREDPADRREFYRRQQRWTRQKQMEEWYWSD